MKIFLVERDIDGITAAELFSSRMRAIRQAALTFEGGDRVRYVRSVFVPGDGRCLCLFEGRNADGVARLNTASRVPFRRIVPAMDLTPWLVEPLDPRHLGDKGLPMRR